MDTQSVLGQNPPNHAIPTLFLFGIRNTKEASKPFEDQTYFRSDAQCFRNRFGAFLLIRNTQQRWVPFGHGVLLWDQKHKHTIDTTLEIMFVWPRSTATLTPFENHDFLIRNTKA